MFKAIEMTWVTLTLKVARGVGSSWVSLDSSQKQCPSLFASCRFQGVARLNQGPVEDQGGSESNWTII